MSEVDVQKEGQPVTYEGKVYSEEEWKQIEYAESQVEHYDMLQHTKKIQL